MPSMHRPIRVVKGSGKENFGGLRGPAHPRPASPPGDLPIGWDEPHAFACFHHLPPAFVDEAVVVVAEGKHVAQVVRSAPSPELDVVSAGPVDRPVAPWAGASPIPRLQCSALRRR